MFSLRNDPRCLLRVLALVLASVLNSFLAILEDVYLRLIGVDIDQIELPDDVIFIVGHPRTGTTLLHTMMALDEDRLCCVRTLDVMTPSSPILVRRFLSPRLLRVLEKFMLPSTRPMDRLPLAFESPQEAELATNCISGGASPYAALSYMTNFQRYLDMLSFENAPPSEFAAWEAAFKRFLRKMVYLHPSKRLVLKSPCHTARLDILRKMFPRSRFVWIHRDPIDVIHSALFMADRFFPCCFLTMPSVEQVLEYTLVQHEMIYKSLFDSSVYRSRDLVEVRFDQLDCSTSGALDVLRDVYTALDISDPPVRRVESFLDDLLIVQGFKKNQPVGWGAAVEDEIARRTKSVRTQLGYHAVL